VAGRRSSREDASDALDSWFDAFSSREPVPTSLENAQLRGSHMISHLPLQ
jgi:hypothetical protein